MDSKLNVDQRDTVPRSHVNDDLSLLAVFTPDYWQGFGQRPEYLPQALVPSIILPAILIHLCLFLANLVEQLWAPIGFSVVVLSANIYAYFHSRQTRHYWLVPLFVAFVYFPLSIVAFQILPVVTCFWMIAVNFFYFATMHYRHALFTTVLLLLPQALMASTQLDSFVVIRFAVCYLMSVYFLTKMTRAMAIALYQADKFARTDDLTRLLNRRAVMQQLEQWHGHYARYHEKQVTLALIDIDHFKRLNDTYGHQFGDQVLKTFAQTLSQSVRSTDVVGRYGGEEFILLLPETNIAGAQKVITGFRNKLMKLNFGHDIQVQFSAGVAELSVPDDLNTWIKRADNALYQAKNSGRNQTITAINKP